MVRQLGSISVCIGFESRNNTLLYSGPRLAPDLRGPPEFFDQPISFTTLINFWTIFPQKISKTEFPRRKE